jgi:hypothetical protein
LQVTHRAWLQMLLAYKNDLNEGEYVEDLHIIFRFSYIFMYLVQVSSGIQFYIEVTCLLYIGNVCFGY